MMRDLDHIRDTVRSEVERGKITLAEGLQRIERESIAATINALGHGKQTMLREIGKRPWLVLTPLVLGFALGLLTHIWF